MSADPFKIFICYAREDKEPLEQLRKKLMPLQQSNRVQLWYDKEITGGKEWDAEIRLNLKSADLVLLLISDDFFDSSYIHSVELREALDGHERRENVVAPVILYDCLWDHHPELSKLQALPEDAKPVFMEEHWKRPDYGFANVARGVVRILDDPEMQVRRERKQKRLAELEKTQAADHARLEAERRQREAETESAQKKAEDEARKKGLPDMVLVKGGTFQMGSNENDGAKPIHSVTLADFEIGKYPVTQKLWMDIMHKNPPSHFEGDDLPVEAVSWYEAQDFLQKLNTRFPGSQYRLPTEAEWEYAARGGEKGAKDNFTYAGSNDLYEVGWYEGNNKRHYGTRSVGGKKPNQLGLYDMSGNVWEWCADCWNDNYQGVPTDGSAWTSGNCDRRVLRGGSWLNEVNYCQVSYRAGLFPDDVSDDIGFRIVRTVL
ncbi:MAG: SUMF1/EgtB/PvdO family nonheme iron enzyme [Saprospiraceae bacterium]